MPDSPTRIPRWLDRLDEPAITGLYLTYVDAVGWPRRLVMTTSTRDG